MLLFSIGLPSPFAHWCDALTARLARHSLGEIQVCGLNTLDEVAVAAIGPPAPHLLIAARQPVVRLQTEVVKSDRPFLLALGDPRLSVRHLVEPAGPHIADAIAAVP